MQNQHPGPPSGAGGAGPQTPFALCGDAAGGGGATPSPDPDPSPVSPSRSRSRSRSGLPLLWLGVSSAASWQRSLRHWKSNKNPAASLLLRSLAIARSLPRQLSWAGVGKSGRRRGAALAGTESLSPPCSSHVAGGSRRGWMGRGRDAGEGSVPPTLTASPLSVQRHHRRGKQEQPRPPSAKLSLPRSLPTDF